MSRFAGKVALVTGAASGIGAATARAFGTEGAAVVLADVADAGPVAAEIGETALAMKLDVREPGDWAAAIAATEARFGRLDVLVNNAGVVSYKGLLDFTPDEIRRMLDINLLGTIFGTQAAIPAMLRGGGGAIVNVSSVDGLIAHNALAPYVASKWGVRGFTKACALEFGHRGIRVNSVHPGAVFTPMANIGDMTKAEFDKGGMMGFPTQRSAFPEEIAAAILYLASSEATYVNGAELAVDGGMTAGQYFNFMPGAPPRV
jgi:3alpha(or 20beta)-hydroxysteroid dehydrogenase